MKHVFLAASLLLLPFSSAFAQAPGVAATPGAAAYSCPMHPDQASDKPGKCSKCGMALVERRPAAAPASTPAPAATPAAATYTCPMHPDAASDKPGKCPKCGMALVAKRAAPPAPATAPAASAAPAAAASYSCPMHPDVVSDKPGKCSKCGMALVEAGKGSKKPSLHDHAPAHGGQLGMVGDNHVEIVIPKPGEYVVWLSDAYRKPLALAKAAGALTVTDASGKIVNAPLALGPKKDSLVATTPAMTGTLNVQVSITGVAPAVIDTEFQFEVK